MENYRHLAPGVVPRNVARSEPHGLAVGFHFAGIDPCEGVQTARVDYLVVLRLDAVPPFEPGVVAGKVELRPGGKRSAKKKRRACKGGKKRSEFFCHTANLVTNNRIAKQTLTELIYSFCCGALRNGGNWLFLSDLM